MNNHIEIIYCDQYPQKIPSYYDKLIIPEKYYDAVISRNINSLNNIIKNNPKLSISVISFYNLTLKGSFFYKKSGKNGSFYKIKWNTKEYNNNIILNFNEQSMLYQYITTCPWNYTNMGFLINSINNYLIKLRYIMYLINNNISVNNFLYLGINVNNNKEMKNYITKFIYSYK